MIRVNLPLEKETGV